MEGTKNQVDILYSENGQNRQNKEPFVVIYNINKWPPRILQRRGYTKMKRVYSRMAVEIEDEHLAKCWRLHALKYKDKEGLIEDESLLLGNDHEEIQILSNL